MTLSAVGLRSAADSNAKRPFAPPTLACIAAVLALEPALAQPAPRVTLTTGLVLEESYVDRRITSGEHTSELVTRLSPGFTWASKVGRLQGDAAYTGGLVYRSGDDDSTEYLNTLAASLRLEAIRDQGFIDARASISQQAISVTGQPVDNSLQQNDNRTEVRTVFVSPYLRGTLTDAAEYEFRVGVSRTNTDSSSAADSHSEIGSFFLRSRQRGNRFGWAVSAQRQRVGFSTATEASITDRASLELSYVPDIDWRLSINGGAEATDVIDGVRRRYDSYGASVQWTPSSRTRVLVRGDERYFGNSHSVILEHRLPRSVFRYSDSREVTDSADLAASGGGSAATTTGYVASGITVQRRQELSWSLQSVRTTFTLSGQRTRSERIDNGGVTPAGVNDDVEQSGYASTLAYRLNPTTSAVLSGSRTMARTVTTGASSDLKALSLALTTQLGHRTAGTLKAGYSVSDGTSDPYREAAISASLSLRF